MKAVSKSNLNTFSAKLKNWVKSNYGELTEGEIDEIVADGYVISATVLNATASPSNPMKVQTGSAATLVFTFDGVNYVCPSTAPVVTGATGAWTKDSDTQGTMVLSNPTEDVSFTVAGKAAWNGQSLAGTTWQMNSSILDTGFSKEVAYALTADSFGDNVHSISPASGFIVSSQYSNFFAFYGTSEPRVYYYPQYGWYYRATSSADRYIYQEPPIIRNIGSYDSSLLEWFKNNATLLDW